MAINGKWNNRYGPGGSARRLHHISRLSAANGDETVSTCVVKTCLLLGIVPPLSG